MSTTLYPIAPVAKPRMTQRDKWQQRPAVLKYRKFKDAVRQAGLTVPPKLHVTFYVPVPTSWSKRKRREMLFTPHQQRPDIDNFIKALLDACLEDDAHIWSITATKLWADAGAIAIHNPQD